MSKKLRLAGMPPYWKAILSLVGANLLLVALIFLLRNRVPPEVPLFYQRAEPSEQIATWYMLSLPSGIAIAIALINGVLAKFLVKDFAKKVLSGASVAVLILSFITVFRILLLVGNF